MQLGRGRAQRRAWGRAVRHSMWSHLWPPVDGDAAHRTAHDLEEQLVSDRQAHTHCPAGPALVHDRLTTLVSHT